MRATCWSAGLAWLISLAVFSGYIVAHYTDDNTGTRIRGDGFQGNRQVSGVERDLGDAGSYKYSLPPAYGTDDVSTPQSSTSETSLDISTSKPSSSVSSETSSFSHKTSIISLKKTVTSILSQSSHSISSGSTSWPTRTGSSVVIDSSVSTVDASEVIAPGATTFWVTLTRVNTATEQISTSASGTFLTTSQETPIVSPESTPSSGSVITITRQVSKTRTIAASSDDKGLGASSATLSSSQASEGKVLASSLSTDSDGDEKKTFTTSAFETVTAISSHNYTKTLWMNSTVSSTPSVASSNLSSENTETTTRTLTKTATLRGSTSRLASSPSTLAEETSSNGQDASTIYLTKVLTVSAIPAVNISTIVTESLESSWGSFSSLTPSSIIHNSSSPSSTTVVLATSVITRTETTTKSRISSHTGPWNSSLVSGGVHSTNWLLTGTGSRRTPTKTSAQKLTSAIILTRTVTSILPPFPTGKNANSTVVGSGVTVSGSATGSLRTSIYEVTTTVDFNKSAVASTPTSRSLETLMTSELSVSPSAAQTSTSTAVVHTEVVFRTATKTLSFGWSSSSEAADAVTASLPANNSSTEGRLSTIEISKDTAVLTVTNVRNSIFSSGKSEPLVSSTTAPWSNSTTATPTISTAFVTSLISNETTITLNGTSAALPATARISKLTLTTVVTVPIAASSSVMITKSLNTLSPETTAGGVNITLTRWQTVTQGQEVSTNYASVTRNCANSTHYPYPLKTSCTTFAESSVSKSKCWAIPTGTGKPWPISPENFTDTCTILATGVNQASTPWWNSTFVGSATGTRPRPVPTTFETKTLVGVPHSESHGFLAPPATATKPAKSTLPENPNYPWGGESPLHRHHNVTRLGTGVHLRELLQRSGWASRWSEIVGKIKGVWQAGGGGPATKDD